MGPRCLNTARFLSGSSCRKSSTVQATFACSLSMRGKEVWIVSRFSRAQNALIYAQVGREETMMIERFGEEYRAYMKRTGRFLPRFKISDEQIYSRSCSFLVRASICHWVFEFASSFPIRFYIVYVYPIQNSIGYVSWAFLRVGCTIESSKRRRDLTLIVHFLHPRCARSNDRWRSSTFTIRMLLKATR